LKESGIILVYRADQQYRVPGIERICTTCGGGTMV
jgi:hypothetical protein